MDNVNFQIQYFPEDKKDEFKLWSKENGGSMKGLLLSLIDHREEIQKILDSEKG